MNAFSLLGGRVPSMAPLAKAEDAPAPAPAGRKEFTFRPLSSPQRQVIGRLATTAFNTMVASGLLPAPPHGKKTAAAEEWRHGEYLAVTGHDDLHQCTQQHFRDLRSHFESIIGTPAASARSFRDNMRTGKATAHSAPEDTHEARELWRHNLNKALTDYGYKPGYAAAICRGKYHRELGTATADQLRSLTFAVIGNARKAGRTPQGEHRADSAPAPSSTKKLTIIRPAREPEPEDEMNPF